MQIEIAEPGRMTQTGSSLLRLIQNNNMPVLDLFVRESVQNSLDAGMPGSSYVSIQFLTGSFSNEVFSRNLEMISDGLLSKYGKSYYDYVAIRDSNTEGLTGPLHYDDVIDNNYGNLLKLIYEISKPQEEEGAGGSWGLGKTVFFRVGIGLVIYYSRIYENNRYQTRMAITLVEDENKQDALIPSVNGRLKRGIAWWGKKTGENKTQPVTDENEINDILRIFGIKPCINDETGTTVIIPYIDKEVLLKNNAIEYLDADENSIHPFWQNSIEDYLSVSLQRWYAPRLNNPEFPYDRYLRVKINENIITNDCMEPEFQIIQSLYNRALGKITQYDVLKELYSDNTHAEDILLRNVLNTTKAGNVAYTRVDRHILKMDYPDNKPVPYMYFNCEVRGKETNKPITSFVRKPGMIVSYEDVGNWADGIPEADSDHYIFSVFVLNSSNYLKDMPEYSLEEYARKSEMADHTSWGDFNINAFNPRIISKVQGQIAKKVSSDFGTQDETTETHMNSGLGKFFGDMLLPPENYGKKPGQISDSPVTPPHIEKHRFVTFTLDNARTEYFSDHMTLYMSLNSIGGIKECEVLLGIDSETGSITVKDWEQQMGLVMPFEISHVKTEFHKTNKTTYAEYFSELSDKNRKSKQKPFDTTLVFSDKNRGYKLRISADNKTPVNADIVMQIKLFRRDIKPVITLEEEEE